jgi:ketosteroid isomerase-like protein
MSKLTEIVLASQDAIMARDVEKYLSFFTDDVEGSDPASPPFHGKEGLRTHVGHLLAALTEMRFLDRKAFPNGKGVALRFAIEAKAGGKTLVIEGVDVFEFDDEDKIRRVTSYYDPSALGV